MSFDFAAARFEWGRMSRAERDAAYNNSDAVPGSAEISAARLDASVAFRATHSAHLDIPYGRAERNKWDLFPAADATAPCLVFIHGGYWQRGSRESSSVLAEGILAHGWSAALPGYTLAPDISLAGLIDELHAALDWLAAEGPDHGIAGPVYVTGWSAGGHLTAMTLSHPIVRAALAISGVFELGPIRDIYLNEKLRLTEQEIATLSPLRLPVVRKPMSLAYGSLELMALVNDSHALHARRAAAHVPGVLIPVAGTNHFTVLDELQKPDGVITRQILDLAR